MSTTRDSPVDLLPARMLNEFVYCPRLFFYEHIEGAFVTYSVISRPTHDLRIFTNQSPFADL